MHIITTTTEIYFDQNGSYPICKICGNRADSGELIYTWDGTEAKFYCECCSDIVRKLLIP